MSIKTLNLCESHLGRVYVAKIGKKVIYRCIKIILKEIYKNNRIISCKTLQFLYYLY